MYNVKDPSSVTLRFMNLSDIVLYLAIFSFTSGWLVFGTMPHNQEYNTVDPKDYFSTQLNMYIPHDWDPSCPDVIDCFKAFVTVHPMPLISLELPVFKLPIFNPDSTVAKDNVLRGAAQLQELSNILGISNRIGGLVGATRVDWTTAEIEICTTSDKVGHSAACRECYPRPGESETTKDEVGYLLYVYCV
jgi:hypothetical protein